MLDMYANSNDGMVFKLVISLGQVGKNIPLESQPRLKLICFKTFAQGYPRYLANVTENFMKEFTAI